MLECRSAGLTDTDKLVDALFRGGLTQETLNDLLAEEVESPHDDNEDGNVNDSATEGNSSGGVFVAPPRPVPVTIRAPSPDAQSGAKHSRWGSDTTSPSRPYHITSSYGHLESHADSPDQEEDQHSEEQRAPVTDHRTIHITNLPEGTTHKDLVGILRGGMLADIYLRNDKSAQVTFLEGAQDFMAYVKKNDLYLHYKRLEFRWSDRQYRIPAHVAYKVAQGATRNLLIRNAASRHLNTEQIADHLDHIHNLAVVEAKIVDGDAYISINSIQNALFGRTCLMSRSLYKGLRIEWYPDDCATPLPQPLPRLYQRLQNSPTNPMKSVNRFSVLEFSDAGSDGATDSSMGNGIRQNIWAGAAVA